MFSPPSIFTPSEKSPPAMKLELQNSHFHFHQPETNPSFHQTKEGEFHKHPKNIFQFFDYPIKFLGIYQMENGDGNDSESDRELRSVTRRRRRSSATILHLLQGIHAGMITDSDDNYNSDGEHERVIVVNPFHQRLIIQGSGGRINPFGSNRPPLNQPMGVLGDYFIGPDIELLLQHLAETSPARYGTRPAQKTAVETLPTVKIEDSSNSCSVCLEDLIVGNEAKEMPCKHMFHGDCILPWLDLHNTCPVCRYQLPFDEMKLKREPDSAHVITGNNRLTGPTRPGNENGESGQDGMEGGTARGLSVTFPRPFNSLFTSTSGTQITNPSLIVNRPESGPEATGEEGGDGRDGDH